MERFPFQQSQHITFQNISVRDAGKGDKSTYVKLKNVFNFFHVCSSSGNVTCHVRNEAGTDQYTYEISVYSPPIHRDATQNLSTFKVILAANFSIDCNIFGIPPPNVGAFISI